MQAQVQETQNAKGEIFKCQEESQERMEWRTIEDVNDVQAGINDEDNTNKCANEANKVHRKEEMGGINNDIHVIKYIFTIKISNDITLLLLLLLLLLLINYYFI